MNTAMNAILGLPDVTPNSCRICLCLSSKLNFPISAEDVEQYEALTGYKIVASDVPKRICSTCKEIMNSLNNFKRKAVEVETYLTQLMIKHEQEIIDKGIKEYVQPLETNVSQEIKVEEYVDESDDDLPDPVVKDDCEPETIDPPTEEEKPKRRRRTKIELLAAADSKNSDQRPPLRCSKCHQTFRSIESRRDHYKFVHKGHDRFSCDICPSKKSFKEKNRIRLHMLLLHTEKTQCTSCDKYLSPTGMPRHWKAHHSNENSYICQHCGKGFAFQNRLTDHLYVYHTTADQWKFECDVCHKKFKKKPALRRHSELHEAQSSFICPICGKKFTMKRYLQLHLNTHEKSGYDCPACSDKFADSKMLRCHIQKHHPEIRLPPSGTILKNFNWKKIMQNK